MRCWASSSGWEAGWYITSASTAISKVAIIGCGDVGLRVATRLRAQNQSITGIVRSAATAQILREQQHEALVHDLDSDTALSISTPLIFYFAPPPTNGTTDPRLRRVLASLTRNTRVIYISTSGVYGDCAGRWIDEDEPLKPLSERAYRRLDAELALAEWRGDYVILRVPGIYGAGRLPLERLRKNLPVVRESESPYTNRIHADDLANAALNAAEHGITGAAYNISDGNPTTMCDYFTRCAVLFDLPSPLQISLAEARTVFTPAMWSFMEESKRLVTTRLREQLHFTPRYATLEQGLSACLTEIVPTRL